MKVIFLDIDGVLVTKQSMEQNMMLQINGGKLSDYAHEIFDANNVANLNHVISETGAKIVVSSTWRLLYKPVILMEHFAKYGINPNVVVGYTPEGLKKLPSGLYTDVERGEEIQAWLYDHPEVEVFIIIDDDADMAQLLPHLVSVEFETGLTEQCAKEAIKLLERKT